MRNLIIGFLVCLHLVPIVLSGKEKRDLLSNKGTIEFLEENLKMGHEWVNYPAYSDRSAWDKIPVDLRNSYILEGEKYLDFNWPTIPAHSLMYQLLNASWASPRLIISCNNSS